MKIFYFLAKTFHEVWMAVLVGFLVGFLLFWVFSLEVDHYSILTKGGEG